MEPFANITKHKFPQDWQSFLKAELKKDYIINLGHFLQREWEQGTKIYPAQQNIFRAFDLTPLKDVKIVIIGQDPYHGEGQADGLCFSVQPGIKLPPSLKNIFKELQLEYGYPIPQNGHLESWAKQGVLMLNAVLTVEEGKAGSHQKKGWEEFTDRVVEVLDRECDHLVFMLWGSHAQKKGAKINRTNHLILKAVHPSPLSAHRGFFACEHFKMANDYLASIGRKKINWKI